MNHKTAMIEAVWGIKKAAFKAAFFYQLYDHYLKVTLVLPMVKPSEYNNTV